MFSAKLLETVVPLHYTDGMNETEIIDTPARTLFSGDVIVGSGFSVEAVTIVPRSGRVAVTGRYPLSLLQTRFFSPTQVLTVRRHVNKIYN